MMQTNANKRLSIRLILIQIIFALISAVLAITIKGWLAGYSLFLGALSGIVPMCLFAFIAFKSQSEDAQVILTSLYSAMLVKYLLTAGLFVLMIVLIKPIDTFFVLVGLILMLVIAALAPALLQTNE